MCGDMKLGGIFHEVLPRAEDLSITDCALEGSKIFGCTNWKSNMSLGANYDSH